MVDAPKLLQGWLLLVLAVVCIVSSSSAAEQANDDTACHIRAANLNTKTSVQTGQPLLSWMLEPTQTTDNNFESEFDVGAQRNLSQSAYEIVVCTSVGCPATSSSLWSSGKVTSVETLNIKYAGSPLTSGQQLYWTVKIWDQNETECAGVASSTFEIGLLDATDWHGSWITKTYSSLLPSSDCELFNSTVPAPMFRSQFSVSTHATLVRARAYISGLGYYRMYINGARVGTSELDPGFTSYGSRVLYAIHNVTEMLQGSEQVTVGVELGNGWWNPLPLLFWGHIDVRSNVDIGSPQFLLELRLEYSDGTTQTIASNEQDWTSGNSSTIFNNIYLGERYDARLQRDGWATTEFDDSEWGPVEIAKAPGGHLEAQEAPPVRKQDVLKTSVIKTTTQGNETVLVLDSGKNHAGACQFQLSGKSGDTIVFKYGELLHTDGSVNFMTSVAGQIKGPNANSPCQPHIAVQTDTMILSGKAGGDTWAPAWSWHGFRYIEATMPVGVSVVEPVLCFPLRSDMASVANFSSSDPHLQQIRTLNRNTVDSNLMSIQSDCPHRERFGYSGDALGTHEPIMNMMNMEMFYRKRVFDMIDSQRSNGGYTETAPFVGISDAGLGNQSGPIGWETYTVVQVYDLYTYYGDIDVLEASFDSLYLYIKLLDTNPAGITRGLGDWMPVEPTSTVYTGLAFLLQSYQAFYKIAAVLGRTDLVEEYTARATNVTNAINTQFLNTTTGLYAAGNGGVSTQTGQGMALSLGIVPSHLVSNAVDVAVDNANSATNIPGGGQGPKVGGPGPHMTSGLAGIQPFLLSLADGDMNDLAYEVVTTPSYPSYRWMMNNAFDNATTIWESWFFSDNTFSHNHPMFCGAETWIIQTVLGIRPALGAKGMSKVLIKPSPIKALQFAKGSLDTVRGTVYVAWSTVSTTTINEAPRIMTLNVTVPPGVQADVEFPKGASAIEESGGYHHVAVQQGQSPRSLAHLTSGTYSFTLVVA